MRIVRLAVLLVLVGLMGTALAQATGYKATIYFRSGNSVKIDHFGTKTKVYPVTLRGILNGQQVKFSLGDLAQIDFTDSSTSYAGTGAASGTAVITNRQGKRFTLTGAWVADPEFYGALDYTYQDPVTGKLTSTQAVIQNNVASVTIGSGTGGAHEGQMKKDPATGEFFPATYLYDPYTGAQLIWASPQQ